MTATGTTTWTGRPMPTPPETNSVGWLTVMGAIVGGIAGAVGAALVYAGNRYQAYLARKTALDIREIDGKAAYTDNLHDDVQRLEMRLDAQSVQIENMKEQAATARESAIERKAEIAHLKNEIEKLNNLVASLQDEKARTQAMHDGEIESLKLEIGERDARIAALEQALADVEVIGVGETAPPVRRKGDGA